MCSPCPLCRGAKKWILAPWIKHQPWHTVDHPMGISPRPLQREPELCAAAPCIQNQQRCLSHSIQGQKDLVLQPCSTHSCALQKTLSSPNQGLQESQIPSSYLLETTPLPGVPWPKPHTSPSTVKAGATPLSHFHGFTKVLLGGNTSHRKHSESRNIF